MNLMQNNYFGYVYGESIDEIINECNLAKNLEIIKDESIEKLIAFVYEKGYSDGRACYRYDLEKIIKNHPDL
ncbi:hypothetical protein QT738_22615 [Xanthomonas citri pv. citri]